tara:strand:- start:8902 stop:9867 length:966 start_codon:yes stop_codon:yes gene_type:complete
LNFLIVGAGAIGFHLSYLLSGKNKNVYVLCRKEKFNLINNNEIFLEINDNDKLIEKVDLKKLNIKFIKTLNECKKINFDYIFITIKLVSNFKKTYENIKTIIKKKTLVITPCTILPSWWLKKYGKKKSYDQNDFNNQILCMTMWISGQMKKNLITIRHTQRGYPIGEIYKKNERDCSKLRKIFQKKTKSPYINDVYGELYLKVINSFAFNLVAIHFEMNNYQLSINRSAINLLKEIMKEFDVIVMKLGLTINQSINSRIKQTLKSKNHTMSMLSDFKQKKKLELENQWKSLNKIRGIKRENIRVSEKIYIKVSSKINNAYI